MRDLSLLFNKMQKGDNFIPNPYFVFAVIEKRRDGKDEKETYFSSSF